MAQDILIVDGDESTRRVLAGIVSSIGCRPTEAKNIREALSRLRSIRFVAALVELELPDGNGIEILKHIKEEELSTPVAVISGLFNVNVIVECLEHGVYDFVPKPFTVARVREAVLKTIAGRPETERAEDFAAYLNLPAAVPRMSVPAHWPEDPFHKALLALVRILGFRECEAYEHAARVRNISITVAGKLGLTDEQTAQLADGALLHDIGKIGVPDSVLMKKGPLSRPEWKVMKQHPEIGYRILEGIESLKGAGEIVLGHHERFDGRGYPVGASRTDIPLTTRIFSVVDAFDAITSDRVYAPARPPEEALVIIGECAGTQFDPDIARIFINIYKRPPE